MKKLWMPALAALALAACNDADPVSPDGPAFAAVPAYGGLYTQTNQAANEVLQYRRDADGSLTFVAAFSTGGAGTGAGLGNQGGVALSGDGQWLFTVNAESNEVVVFRRSVDGSLSLADRVDSQGEMPISVTQRGRSVYVLNTGGDGNIAGFRLSGDGTLAPLGTQPLSQTGGVAAAQIQFAPNGRHLIVTEKNTGRIVVYPVVAGTAGAPMAQASDGATPFGFAFRNGTLIVSNAAGGGAGLGSATSYDVGADGQLHVISSQVANGQSAPCWFVVTRNGRFAYTTNTASNNTSGYAVGPDGSLTLLGNGATAANSGAPIDAAINPSGAEFLHVLNGATGEIQVFAIAGDGSLSFVSDTGGLPAGTNGLAAY